MAHTALPQAARTCRNRRFALTTPVAHAEGTRTVVVRPGAAGPLHEALPVQHVVRVAWLASAAPDSEAHPASQRRSHDFNWHGAASGATQAAGSVWMARLGRLGLGARGVLYVLVAYLAVRVAFGQPNRGTDRQGALHTVARQPFGHVLLAALAVGFGAYASW